MLRWFQNLKIAQKIMVLIAIMASFTTIVGFTGFYFNQQSAATADDLYHKKLLPVTWLKDICIDLSMNRGNVLAIISEPDKAVQNRYVENIDKRAEEVLDLIAKYEKQDLDPTERQLLTNLKSNLTEYKVARAKIIDLALNGKRQEAFREAKIASSLFDNVTNDSEKLAAYSVELAEKLNTQSDKDSATVSNVIMIIILTAVALSISIGLFIGHSIARRLASVVDHIHVVSGGNLAVEDLKILAEDEIGSLGRAFNNMAHHLRSLIKEINTSATDVTASSEEMYAAAEQTAQSSQQVSTSINQLALGAQEQANSITESVVNLEQINASIQDVLSNIDTAISISKATETNANDGRDKANTAVSKSRDVKETSVVVSNVINELGVLSSEIGIIVDLIKNIAGQTNLLALNAAIEAARAGEHGKGFAVVADEVKKLANQSAEATEKITEMIKEIQSKTTSAVTTMNKTQEEVDESVELIAEVERSLKKIATASVTTNKHIQDVSTKVTSLSKNSDNVVRTMENISSITEQSAASAQEISGMTEESTASIEEINASAGSLAQIAEHLQSMISVFKV